MKQVIVHIGTEKTGTTTLQEFLHINKTFLKDRGVSVLESPGKMNNIKLPVYCMDLNRLDGRIMGLGLTTEHEWKIWKDNFKTDLEQELNGLENEINTVIISSEHFHSRLIHPSEILNLYNLLRNWFSEIKIIIYLRRQDQVAVSLFSTKCISGVCTHFDIFQGRNFEKSHYYNYFSVLNKWSEIFEKENIIPRVYDKNKLINQDLIDDFIKTTGLFELSEPFTRPNNKNEAISEIVQAILISFNRKFPSHINNKPCQFSGKVRKQLVSELTKLIKGPPMMPSREKALKFYQNFAESNHMLASTWFGGSNIFSEDFSMYPEEETIISINPEVLDTLFYVLAGIFDNQE